MHDFFVYFSRSGLAPQTLIDSKFKSKVIPNAFLESLEAMCLLMEMKKQNPLLQVLSVERRKPIYVDRNHAAS